MPRTLLAKLKVRLLPTRGRFDPQLQRVLLCHGMFPMVEAGLEDLAVGDRCMVVVLALVRFNKDVFVGPSSWARHRRAGGVHVCVLVWVSGGDLHPGGRDPRAQRALAAHHFDLPSLGYGASPLDQAPTGVVVLVARGYGEQVDL
jgi:hypothetical protein